jgi:lipoprotein NlpD
MTMLRAMPKPSLNVSLTVAQRSVCVVALSLLTACATRLDNAPVIDRSASLNTPGGQTPPANAPLPPAPPGYYRVKPGDTLYRIALENGQNYRDIAAWNNLADPNQIEVDQLLRVAPPGANVAAMTPGVTTSPVAGGGVQSAPIGASSGAAGVPPGSGVTATTIPPQPPVNDMPAATGPISFAWPARGPIIGTFNDTTNKGINIGGNAGDPVRAAAGGRVVYAGNGLRGYGNLIIIKHDATYLTAYAHNRALMVKEGDAVTKGQKIAEMGNSDSDRVMLHFEVRRQGKPVDPLKYLPPQ